MSFWSGPTLAAKNAVAAPTIVTTSSATGAYSNMGDRRQTMNTPAVTMVAAWMRAETGVGPSMASGSQVWSGSCADFPQAPRKRSRLIAVAVPMASVGALANTSPYSSVPSVVQSSMTPRANPQSPTRLTMKAFLPALAADSRVYQN